MCHPTCPLTGCPLSTFALPACPLFLPSWICYTCPQPLFFVPVLYLGLLCIYLSSTTICLCFRCHQLHALHLFNIPIILSWYLYLWSAYASAYLPQHLSFPVYSAPPLCACPVSSPVSLWPECVTTQVTVLLFMIFINGGLSRCRQVCLALQVMYEISKPLLRTSWRKSCHCRQASSVLCATVLWCRLLSNVTVN